MKILKIFGIVVGIHVFALILIFANPGCSSTSKTPPSPSDTAAPPETTPTVSAPASTPPSSIYSSTTDSSTSAPPITFNPDAPAIAAPTSGGTRAAPTRPGTPGANVLVSEPVSDVTAVTSYTVKSGDNLWTIARKNNLTVAQLRSANNLSESASLRPGQKLLIPARPAPTITAPPATNGANANKGSGATAAASNRGSSEMKHVVKSGETLGGIARRYGVKQSDLGSLNNIADPGKIHPGMELIIPGWKGTSGKSASKSAKKAPAPSETPTSTPSSAPVTEPAPIPPAETQTEPTSAPQPTVPVIKIDEPAPEPKQP